LGKYREVLREFSSYYAGNNGDRKMSKMYCSESQSIVSVSHAPDYRRLGGSSSDIGGPFFSTKLKWGVTPAKVHLQGDLTPSDAGWKSGGVLVPSIFETESRGGAYGTPALLAGTAPPAESESSMLAKGATAISRVAPTNPVWDGASALAELYSAKEFLRPPLTNSKTGKYISTRDDLKEVNTAGEFLNIQFGYIPTASDILEFRHTAEHSEKILSALEKGSGQVIRRNYEFPVQELAPRGPYTGSAFPVFLGGGQPTVYEVGLGTWRLQYTRTQSQRFSGAFTYHLPHKGTWRRKIAELDHLYGFRPGVDTAWNAVPNSWLADYYGNMGDVLKNITSFAQDGLVMKYGYLTSVTEDVGQWTWSYPIRRKGDRNAWSSYSGSAQHTCKVITRMPANPFGFGPTGVPLTGRQKAIVAALGLSRV